MADCIYFIDSQQMYYEQRSIKLIKQLNNYILYSLFLCGILYKYIKHTSINNVTRNTSYIQFETKIVIIYLLYNKTNFRIKYNIVIM